MTSRFLPMILCFVFVLRAVAAASQLQDDASHAMYIQQQQQQQRVPILYEAYYPEPRDLSAQTRLQEIDKLRELTSELLQQEERLKQLASEIAVAPDEQENVFAPRSQMLEYVFSRPVIPLNERVHTMIPSSPSSPTTKKDDVDDDGVGIASLTVSDEEQQQQRPRHKIRHRHGEWLLRRLANRLRD